MQSQHADTFTEHEGDVEFIDVPYAPDGAKGWQVPIPGDGLQSFSNRDEAMKFALKLVKKYSSERDEAACLCVEGGDGQWRLFTADLLPLR